MKKLQSLRQRKLIWIVLAILVATVLGSLAYLNYPTRSWSVKFQQYEPTNIPRGATVTSRTMEIWDKRGKPWSHNKLLRFETNEAGLSIGQESVESLAAGWSGIESCSSRKVENESCTERTTPGGQWYVTTCSTNFDNEISRCDTYFIKGNTYIFISQQENPRQFSEQDLNSFIDSFQPVTYKKLPIERFQPGP